MHHILFLKTTNIMAWNIIHNLYKHKQKKYPINPTFILLMVYLPSQNTNKMWQESSL